MPLRLTFLAMVVLGLFACQTSSHNAVIVSTMEACAGDILSAQSRAIRDAVLVDISSELMIPNHQQAVLLRTASIPEPIHGVIAEPLIAVLGAAQTEELLPTIARQTCWHDSAARGPVLPSTTVSPAEFWSTFRRNNPTLSGFVIVTDPVFAEGTIASAFVIVDYHCGEQCGTMWLITVNKRGMSWSAAGRHLLAQY